MAGKFKKPREETQLYINGKYFIQLTWSLNDKDKETVTHFIKTLYCYGYDLPEIKDCLKQAFYQQD